MTDAAALWTAVKSNYDNGGLVTLTNINVRSATTINDTVGTAAAQSTINLFPAYAQIGYDGTNVLHVEAGMLGVIAVLWRRGGSAATIEQVRWDEVFGNDGVIAKLKMTGARGHGSPTTNSGVVQSSELNSDGQRSRPWSDRRALPIEWMPKRLYEDGS